ncbi:hypothetical protein ACNOYE_32515 [Nannocystaceae bacterium ST9]
MNATLDPAQRRAIVPYAKTELRRWRKWWGVLGGLLLLVGVAAVTIVGVAAKPSDQPGVLIAIFVVIAVLPGAAMLAHALARLDRHPLVHALERGPERLRSIGFTYSQTIEGDYVDVVRVELIGGRSYVFWVPKSIIAIDERERRKQSA